MENIKQEAKILLERINPIVWVNSISGNTSYVRDFVERSGGWENASKSEPINSYLKRAEEYLRDKQMNYKRIPEKIGLDLDEVVCGFNQGFINEANKMGLAEHFANSAEEVHSWDLGSSRDKFLEVFKYIQLDPDFWLNLAPLNYPDFVPYCYITSRPIAGAVTNQWLADKGMPYAPLITVSAPERKLAHIIQLELDLFVDDYYPTIRGVIEAGAKGVLFSSPYQSGHDCSGLPIVNVLEYEELKKFI